MQILSQTMIRMINDYCEFHDEPKEESFATADVTARGLRIMYEKSAAASFKALKTAVEYFQQREQYSMVLNHVSIFKS